MFSLRQVVFFTLFWIFQMISATAFAANGVFRSTTDLLRSHGSASTLSQDSSLQNQGFTQSFDILSPTLNKKWILSATMQLSQLDESQLVTKGNKGQDLSWNTKHNQTTSVLTTGVNYSEGIFNSTIRAGKSLDSSVFQTRTFLVENIWSLLSMTTLLGIQFSHDEINRPANYYFDNFFSDSSLKWQPRPTRLTRDRWIASVEQIWTEHYKTRTELLYQPRNQERPSSAGLTFKNSYSFNSRQVLRADLGTASEDRRQALLDERGYFQMNWLEGAFSQGVTYDLWFTLSYGFLQEFESDPRSGRKTQIGSDIYGLKAQYLGQGWRASVKWEFLESNNQFQSQQTQGAFEWEI